MENIYFNAIKTVHKDRPDTEISAFVKKHVNEGAVDPKTFKKNGVDYFEKLDKRMGVFSVSRCNNYILMWAHYANSHRRYCLGLDTQEILNTDGIDYIGKVNYFSELPVIIPTGEFRDQFVKQIFSNWDK